MYLYRYDKEVGPREFPVHIGPYRSEVYGGEEIIPSWDHQGSYHPTPHEDGIKNFCFGDICWCTSIENLYDWFDGYNDEIIENGFEILMIEVPDDYENVGESLRQATTSKAMLLERSFKMEDFNVRH